MSDTTDWIQHVSTIIALVSAVGAVVAAVAAWKSAQTARESNDKLDAMHKSDLFRQASLLANKVVSTTVRVDDLGNDLKLEYNTLFAFAGQGRGERAKLHIDAVETKQKAIGPMQEKARKYLDEKKDVKTLDAGSLIEVIAEFIIHLLSPKVYRY